MTNEATLVSFRFQGKVKVFLLFNIAKDAEIVILVGLTDLRRNNNFSKIVLISFTSFFQSLKGRLGEFENLRIINPLMFKLS